MTAELISVVIPAHNVECFIGQTLSSVLDQSYRNIEVIVVDDGSTDETSRVVRTFIERDNRVSLISNSKSRSFGCPKPRDLEKPSQIHCAD